MHFGQFMHLFDALSKVTYIALSVLAFLGNRTQNLGVGVVSTLHYCMSFTNLVRYVNGVIFFILPDIHLIAFS